MIFKPGDNVLFQVRENKPPYAKGVILRQNKFGNYAIACIDGIIKDVNPTWIVPISDVDNVRNQIIHNYEEKICKLRNQITAETSKSTVVIDKLANIAKKLVDEDDIENKLHIVSGICNVIKENNIDNCVSIIRKNNKRIKGEINNKLFERDMILQSISDESIKRDFDF